MKRAITLAAGLLGGCIGGLGGSEDQAERAYFEAEVLPVLEQDCGTSACHAADDAGFEALDPEYFVFPVDSEGRIAGAERIDRAYHRSLEKLAPEGPEFGDLVRKPLDEALGGLAHRGGSQYRTMSAEALKTLMHWAELARPEQPPAPSPLVTQFRDEVQPILVEKRCMLSSCHGASSSNMLRLDPGFLGRFDSLSTQRNYDSVVQHLNFESADPGLSRFIRKTVPQEHGGIFHRGGNDFFDAVRDADQLERLTAFVTAARTELGDDDKGEVTGVVFVATDPTPRPLFDLSVWQPGGDVHALVPASPDGVLTNLTAAHHAEPADIRDPSVNYDGTRVAFAMRRNQADCLNLYVMDINGSNLVQLTHDTGVLPNGTKIANVEPLWGPDDRLYFVSSREGEVSSHAALPRSNIYRIDADGANLLRMSFSAGSEVSPAWRFAPVGGDRPEIRTLDLTFTATRKVGAIMRAPLMRVPPDFHADYHPHYGTQHPEYQTFTQMSRLPDNRDALLLMDDSTVWEGGALALIDRNLGPVITDQRTPAVVNYVDSLQRLNAIGETVSHAGYSASGYYRDPFALPDGRLLVSHQPTPLDLADAGTPPDPALYRLELLDLPGNITRVSRKELLIDIPGKVETDPRPIVRQRREQIGDPTHHLSNEVTTGRLLNFDLAVAMTVANQDSPSGVKDFAAMSDQIRYVRVVEDVPGTLAADVGRGGHGIRRVLAELPATSDRSIYLELPAGVPFYLQTLDHSRAATSTFNQWYFLLPGEKLLQVTRREVFNTRCGGCHGSISGAPGDTVTTPDVLSEASRVVANYDAAARADVAPVPQGLTPATRLEVDFEADVQPVLDTRCALAGCHASGGQVPDLSARAGSAGFSGSYEALTAPGTASRGGFAYTDPTSSSARTSYLAEVIIGADLGAPRSFDSAGCDAPQQLTLMELGSLMRWMDLGASYRGRAPQQDPTLPTY